MLNFMTCLWNANQNHNEAPGPGLSFGKMSDIAVANTQTLNLKLQELTNAYRLPSNFLEINIFNPQTVGVGCARFNHLWDLRVDKTTCFQTEGVLCMMVLQWLWVTKNELEQERKIVLIVPPLHGKALKWQLPFQGKKRVFEESFIEERR